jgi:hypothetical protein
VANRDIYVAIRSFVTDFEGKRTRVVSGKTFVRAGHDLLVGREHLFVKVVPQYEVEAPKPAPRKKVEVKPKIENDEYVISAEAGTDILHDED